MDGSSLVVPLSRLVPWLGPVCPWPTRGCDTFGGILNRRERPLHRVEPPRIKSAKPSWGLALVWSRSDTKESIRRDRPGREVRTTLRFGRSQSIAARRAAGVVQLLRSVPVPASRPSGLILLELPVSRPPGSVRLPSLPSIDGIQPRRRVGHAVILPILRRPADRFGINGFARTD